MSNLLKSESLKLLKVLVRIELKMKRSCFKMGGGVAHLRQLKKEH